MLETVLITQPIIAFQWQNFEVENKQIEAVTQLMPQFQIYFPENCGI